MLFMRWAVSVSILSDLVCAADDLMRKLSADKNGAVDIILRHNRVEVSGDCGVVCASVRYSEISHSSNACYDGWFLYP